MEPQAHPLDRDIRLAKRVFIALAITAGVAATVAATIWLGTAALLLKSL